MVKGVSAEKGIQEVLIGPQDEMVTWVPLESTDSPNRVDALVWAASESLMEAESLTWILAPLSRIRELATRVAD